MRAREAEAMVWKRYHEDYLSPGTSAIYARNSSKLTQVPTDQQARTRIILDEDAKSDRAGADSSRHNAGKHIDESCG